MRCQFNISMASVRLRRPRPGSTTRTNGCLKGLPSVTVWLLTDLPLYTFGGTRALTLFVRSYTAGWTLAILLVDTTPWVLTGLAAVY